MLFTAVAIVVSEASSKPRREHDRADCHRGVPASGTALSAGARRDSRRLDGFHDAHLHSPHAIVYSSGSADYHNGSTAFLDVAGFIVIVVMVGMLGFLF